MNSVSTVDTNENMPIRLLKSLSHLNTSKKRQIFHISSTPYLRGLNEDLMWISYVENN